MRGLMQDWPMRVHRFIDHAIAEGPVLEHLRLRVGVALDPVAAAAMLRPELKRRFVALQIQVRKEQRVIRHLPERVLVIGVRPLVCRTALDGFTQHRERGVVLALENGSERGVRHGGAHATSARRSGLSADYFGCTITVPVSNACASQVKV